MSSQLSLLVHSFNQYQFLWKGCFDSWENHMNQYCPAYFGTDFTDHEKYEQSRFKVIYSGGGEWSDRLKALLHQIPTDYVLYCQEDHWLSKSPPNLSEAMKIVSERDLLRLHLGPVNQHYKITGDECGLYFHITSKYLVSHQPSIWKKSFLLECLFPNETPWKNEYEGTIRLNNREDLKNRIGIIHYNWYDHKCKQGKIID